MPHGMVSFQTTITFISTHTSSTETYPLEITDYLQPRSFMTPSPTQDILPPHYRSLSQE